MKRREFVSDRGGRRAYERMRRSAVPLLGAGILALPTVDPRQAELPIAYLDCRQRPDVADLARVHRLEGDGDQVATWTFVLAPGVPGIRSLAVLDLRLYRPVHCRFSIAFEMAYHAPVLAAIVQTGRLATTHLDPTGATTNREILVASVGWDVPGDQLRAALATDTVVQLASVIVTEWAS